MRALVFSISIAVTLGAAGCGGDPLVDVPGGLEGQICSSTTGRPAAGATVVATYNSPVTHAHETRSAVADDHGFVHFLGIPATAVKLDVRVPDDFVASFDIPVSPGTPTQLIDPACRDLPGDPGVGTVTGDVCNRHTGGFVRSADVFVLKADGTRVATQTDANGHFVLPGVPAGNQDVIIEKLNAYRDHKQVVVVKDTTVNIDDASETCAPPNPLTTGTITGSICGTDAPGDPGGPLGDVHVFVDGGVDGFAYEDYTLDDGTFAIAGIPVSAAGITVNVRAEKGLFAYEWSGVVVVPAAQSITDLTASEGCQPLSPDLDKKLLVVRGFYDHIEGAVRRMGFAPETQEGDPDDFHDWTVDAFEPLSYLESFDVVFVNCGVNPGVWQNGLSATANANLKQYVKDGGTLYVSDWAYPIVEQVWPEKINFIGDDTIPDAADIGVGHTIYHAHITDPGLADYEGGDTIDVDINFARFAAASQVATDVTPFLTADEQYAFDGGQPQILHAAPMTMRFSYGAGRVIFTSFHQEQDSSHTCTAAADCDSGLTCDAVDAICVAPVDGPEDLVLRYLVFHL